MVSIADSVFGIIYYKMYLFVTWILIISSMFFVEYYHEPYKMFTNWPAWVRWPVYWLLLISIFALGFSGQSTFIYFQF